MNTVIQTIWNRSPFRKQLQALKRAIIPYRSDPGNDWALLDEATRMVAAIRDAGFSLRGTTVVEIGTGWVPILPLIFRAGGASKVITVDHDRLTDRQTFVHAITYIRENLTRVLGCSAVSPSLFYLASLPSRSHSSLVALCRAGSIDYRAPFNFTDLEPDSVDMVVSRATLEHIPENLLREFFQHAAQAVKPGGIMCHMIDLSDHLEHKNKSLSRVDMLRYSEEEWAARTRHRLNHLGRLRWYEYVDLMHQAGWVIDKAPGAPDPKSVEALKTMPLTRRYADVPHEDLAILEVMIIAVRPA